MHHTMTSPDIHMATAVLRSYKRAVDASSQNPTAITAWVEQAAGVHSRSREFPQDAAIGLLSYLAHPLYVSANITSDQQAWASLIASAEQVLQAENSWSSGQIQRGNNTTFMRLFGSDITWIKTWAQSQNLNLSNGDEFLVNRVLEQFASQQSTIPHTPIYP